MGDLRNEFCLSASRLRLIGWCVRSYYWNVYGSWGGWDRRADPTARLAYSLKNGRSLQATVGIAVHKAMDARAWDRVDTVDVGQLVAEARASLRRWLLQDAEQAWRVDPKGRPMVLERYYGEPLDAEAADARVERLIHAGLDSEVWRVVETGWERTGRSPVVRVENRDALLVHVDGYRFPVWVIPDLVYDWWTEEDDEPSGREAADWKTGSRRDSDRTQALLYGLWLHRRHEGEGSVLLEYLGDRSSERYEVSGERAVDAVLLLRSGLELVRQFLVGHDVTRNEPLPIEAWPMVEADSRKCEFCEYRRLCGRG